MLVDLLVSAFCKNYRLLPLFPNSIDQYHEGHKCFAK